MYQNWCRSRCRRRRGLLKLPINGCRELTGEAQRNSQGMENIRRKLTHGTHKEYTGNGCRIRLICRERSDITSRNLKDGMNKILYEEGLGEQEKHEGTRRK